MQTALVTGGSRGIGREIVRMLRGEGYQVDFCYLRSAQDALSLSQECGAVAVQCDVRSTEQVHACVCNMLERYRHIDVLINNAGVAWSGLLTDMTDSEWSSVTETCLGGAFRFCREVLPSMVQRQNGRIVNISSIWGQVGASCEAAYSAAKAGVIGLTKALAKEVGPSGITVNCISPGVIETDMLRPYSREDLEELRQETPLMRLGTPGDVAECVRYLISPGAGFVTGQVVGVGGGFGE